LYSCLYSVNIAIIEKFSNIDRHHYRHPVLTARLNTGGRAGPDDPEDCLGYPRERGMPFRGMPSWGSMGGTRPVSLALPFVSFSLLGRYCFPYRAKVKQLAAPSLRGHSKFLENLFKT